MLNSVKDSEISMTIDEKYGIVYIENERFYTFSLFEKRFDLESTRPLFVRIDGKILEAHTWGSLIVMVLDYAISKKNCTKEMLLNFNVTWSNSSIISDVKSIRTDFDLKNGLYVNTNHTSVHCCWIIQDFLKYCGYDLSEISIVIKRTGSSEKAEVRDYYISKNISGFNTYINENYPTEKRTRYLKCANFVKAVDEKITRKALKSVYSIYLIDNVQAMYKCKADLLTYLKNKTAVKKEQLEFITEGLNLYYEYIKQLHKSDSR